MKILYVLYGDMFCNSAAHADGLCRALSQLGHECSIAVPREPTKAEVFTGRRYEVITHSQALQRQARQGNSAPAFDVVHAWTPREAVRQVSLKLAGNGRTRLCVHLEDNEDELRLAQLGLLRNDAYRHGLASPEFPRHLSHPIRSASLLASADGISVIIEKLLDKIPGGTKSTVIWPSADGDVFHPRPPDPALRRELGVPEGSLMLCYHGNVHGSNRAEVRSLYLAAALLSREGFPARLVRTGRNFVDADPGYRQWASQFSVELGYVEDRHRLGRIVAEADILVQPGAPGPFNDYRFPSKLADFFASGKPVVLPRTNIGLVTRHGEDAYILDVADGAAIADAAREISGNSELKSRLSKGARDFYASHLQWSVAAARLLGLYENMIAAPPRPKIME